MAAAAMPDDLRPLLNRLAEAAAAETLPRFRANHDIVNKQRRGFDPVTEADRAAEKSLRRLLRQERGEDSVIGEEEGFIEGSSGWTWLLDPIDGTRSFITSQPTWGTLVGLRRGETPAWGMMDQPFTGERYIGGPGFSELHRHGEVTALRTRACADLGAAHIVLPSLYRTDYPDGTGALFRRIGAAAELVRSGGDCYRYASVAYGQIDAVIDRGLRIWDFEPMIPIVEGAGGILTQWDGSPTEDRGTILCCGDAALHAVLMRHLADDRE